MGARRARSGAHAPRDPHRSRTTPALTGSAAPCPAGEAPPRPAPRAAAGPSIPPAALRLGPVRARNGGIRSPTRKRFIVAGFPSLFSQLFFLTFSSPIIFSFYFPLPSLSDLFCVLFRCPFPSVSACRWQVPRGRERRDGVGAPQKLISAAGGKGLPAERRLDAAHPRSAYLLRPVCGRAAPTDPNRLDHVVGAAVPASSPVTS